MKRVPTSTWLARQLGQLYTKIGRHGESIDLYRHRISQFPIRSHLWDGLATALASKGSFQEAVDTYKQALERNPSVTWLWFRLADLYEQGGDVERALDAYKKALCGNPCENIPSLHGLLDVSLPYIPVEDVVNARLMSLFPWTKIYLIFSLWERRQKPARCLMK